MRNATRTETDGLSHHEVETIRVILRNGGKVRVTMGRLGVADVRTVTVNKLLESGILRVWGRPNETHVMGGVHDLAVTAEGCRRYHLRVSETV